MINRLLFILLAVLGALNAGAQAIDAIPRTTTFTNTDLLLVQTNSAGAAGQKFSRSITASNFLESLKSFSNWTGGNGSGTVTNAVLTNIIATGAITNKWNAWQFWCDPVSTNTYHAENRGLGIKTNSTDFGALLQSVLNRGTEGFSYKFEPNPFYTNAYVISNTVIVTNWGTWSGDLAGNPTVAFRASTNFTGPLFQLGAHGMQLGGISGWRDIRFEGDQGSTNCTGVETINARDAPITSKMRLPRRR